MIVPRLPGAYYLRHLPTGKYYIGSSGSLYFRLSVHKSTLLKGKHTNKNLQELFTRWEDFSFEMHICDTREEAYDKEQSMLDAHAGDPLMCNIGTLARGNYESNGAVKAAVAKMKSSPPTHWVGRKHSDETRAKMKTSRATSTGGHTEKSKAELSERMKGNTVWAGRTHTEEAKLKTAMAKWKPVSVNGSDYPSIGHAAIALGISPNATGMRVRSKDPRWSEWKFT